MSRVENPGSKIRLTTRGSSAAVPGAIIPSAIPLRTIFSRSSPRPSSSTRIATRSPSWPAESVIRPTRGFPFSSRSCGCLQRMVDGVADQVDHRVAQPLDDRPVQPRLLADDPQLDLLARAVGQVADDPGEPREQLVDRDHPQVERRVADLPADPLERLEGVQPGLDAVDLAQAHEVVGEDGQLAGQADQVVELGGVDPDAGVGARARCAREARPLRGRRRRPRPRSGVGPVTGDGGDGKASSRPRRRFRAARPEIGLRRAASRPLPAIRRDRGGARPPPRPSDREPIVRRRLAARSMTVLSSVKNRKTSSSRSGSASVSRHGSSSQVAAFRIDLVEGGDCLGIRLDRGLAQLAELVEDAEGIDPPPERVGPGARVIR